MWVCEGVVVVEVDGEVWGRKGRGHIAMGETQKRREEETEKGDGVRTEDMGGVRM